MINDIMVYADNAAACRRALPMHLCNIAMRPLTTTDRSDITAVLNLLANGEGKAAVKRFVMPCSSRPPRIFKNLEELVVHVTRDMMEGGGSGGGGGGNAAELDDLKTRISESTCCPVGMEDDGFLMRVVTGGCCKNVFDFANLVACTRRSDKCPMCNRQLHSEDLCVVLQRFNAHQKVARARTHTHTHSFSGEVSPHHLGRL